MEKVIEGFPDYTIDDNGNVYNRKAGRFLRGSIMTTGYRTVELFNAPGTSKRVLVHRLVAKAFIPNPNGFPVVNHKDEDKTNNAASNLEWCTYRYNVNYGTAPERRTKKLTTFRASEKIKALARVNGKAASRPVIQITKSGEVLAEYESAREATRKTNIHYSHICDVCKGKRKSAGGYCWRFKEKGREDLSLSL